jgi:hypothetical protein
MVEKDKDMTYICTKKHEYIPKSIPPGRARGNKQAKLTRLAERLAARLKRRRAAEKRKAQ